MLNLRLFIGKPNFLWSFYSVLVLYNCSFICLFCCCNSNHSLISCWANSTFKVGFTDGNLCMSHLCMINIIITVWVIGQIFLLVQQCRMTTIFIWKHNAVYILMRKPVSLLLGIRLSTMGSNPESWFRSSSSSHLSTSGHHGFSSQINVKKFIIMCINDLNPIQILSYVHYVI